MSNFSEKTLKVLLNHAKIIPVTNQVEMHPCLPRHDLLEFCNSRGILLTAYTPLGKYRIASDPNIIAIADRMSVPPAQVLLSWGVQRGAAVVPKTVHEDRMRQNLEVS